MDTDSVIDYAAWAQQYASTVKHWGIVPSLAQHWVEDLVREQPEADPMIAHAAIRRMVQS